MNWIRNVPIKGKLLLISVITTLIPLILAYVVFITFERQSTKADLEKRLSSLAELVGRETQVALKKGDRSRLEQLLAVQDINIDFNAVTVLLPDGTVYAGYPTGLDTSSIADPATTSGFIFLDDYWELFHPVMKGDTVIATVYFQYRTDAMNIQRVRYNTVFLVILVVSMLLTLILSARLQRLISGPVLHLHDTAREIASESDFSRRAEVCGTDEIGMLAEAFNGVLEEIEERDAALQSSNAQLVQAQKMEAIGRLAGGVAHDFNNMLSVIIGYGHSMLKNKNPDDPDHELLEEIVHAGERSAELTHQLLAFSRQQILQPKVINLNRVLADLDRMLSRLIGEDIELVLDLHEDLGNVYADPVQIQQVVMNLAINARDAMPNGGKLTISTEPFMEDIADETRMKVEQNEQKPLIVLRVQDNGVGMDEQTQARIFEPFFTTKTKYKGIGLGLAMVFGFVKQSGGDITVRSAVGEGTTFSMFLPEVTEAEYVTNEFDTRTVQAVGSGKKKETILVVEDETEVRKMISFILEADGYKIVAADSGPAALKLLDEHKKDIELMLTDVIMPTMSGSDLAKEVRSICPDLQVIYMTGYSDSVILARDVLMSDSYMLRKPFAPKVLRAQVRTALDASTAK